MNAWLDKLYETFIETGYYTMMLDGLKNTLNTNTYIGYTTTYPNGHAFGKKACVACAHTTTCGNISPTVL